MNATRRVDKSTVMAIFAVLAISAVLLGAIPTVDAAADDSQNAPQKLWKFDLTLGNTEGPDGDHSEYWTTSFDFGDNNGKWPYGDKAVMAVKFFFSDGGNIADMYAYNYGAGSLYSSEYVVVPVFEFNGMPYVEDVLCTPDLWPVGPDGTIYAYPVQAEAVLYTDLYNEDDDNDKKQFIIGTAFDYAAFEYKIQYIDVDTGADVADPVFGWADWAVDRNGNGVFVRNLSTRFYGLEYNESGFRTYAPIPDPEGYKLITNNNELPDNEYVQKFHKYQTLPGKDTIEYEIGKGYFLPVGITSPDCPWANGMPTGESKKPWDVLTYTDKKGQHEITYNQLVSSLGGLSCDDIQAGYGSPVIDQDSYEGISPYNVITFYYKGIITVHFRVGADSTGLGNVSEPIDVDVYKGTTAVVDKNVITLTYNGKKVAIDTATEIDTDKYDRSFDLWNNVTDDRSEDYVKTILEETWYYAHFDEKVNMIKVHFLVDTDSQGLGKVATGVKEVADFEVPYDTVAAKVGDQIVLTDEDGKVYTDTPKANDIAGYNVDFGDWFGADDDATPITVLIQEETWYYAHFDKDIVRIAVHFRVDSDSVDADKKKLGNVSTATGEQDDYKVPYGSTVTIASDGKVTITGKDNSGKVETYTNTPAPITKTGYTVKFVKWFGADDDKTAANTQPIVNETWYWAHFEEKGKPVQVEVKYVSEGLPIAIDGQNIDWVTASYFGKDISINYTENFSADTAKKLDAAYTLKKGFLVIPSDPTNQGATVELKNVQTDTVVIQFEFDKNVTYIQRHMYDVGEFPVTAMPEAYGLDATVTVTATDTDDKGKTAKVLITDDADGKGTYIGVGQTGTYNGHTYTVVKGDLQLKDPDRRDDVKVLIDGEINVCSADKPLPFWYQFI